MTDWDELLKIAGALASGGLLAAILARRTGRETVRMTRETAELQAITARLQTDLDVLVAGQAMWKAAFDSSSERIDQQEREAAASRADREAMRVEHQQCRRDLAIVQTEVRTLRAVVEGRQAPRD